MISLPAIHPFVDLKLLQKIVGGTSLLAITFIPVDYFLVSKSGAAPPMPAASESVQAKIQIQTEPFEAYQTVFEKSSFFGNPVSADAPVIKATIQELIKDYRLKGTIITGDPEAIIQDARTQQSLFVHKGHQLGELSVKEITEGSVTLSYLSEEVKLHIE